MAKVAVMECGSYDINLLTEKVSKGIEALGGWGYLGLRPGMKVLLKPNMLGAHPDEAAVTTHTALLRAVIRMVKAQYCEVWVGDSAGGAIMGHLNTERALNATGYNRMGQEEGATVLNFDKFGPSIIRTASGEDMPIARPALEADYIINMPKLKTHMLTGMTAALKNYFGCVPGLKKAEYHRYFPTAEKMGTVLADIHEAVRNDLVIMDAVTAMHKAGPTDGEKYEAKKLLIGTDWLAVDAVAIRMTGRDISRLCAYNASIERELGEWKAENIQIMGDYSKAPHLPGWKLPFVTGLASRLGGLQSAYLAYNKTVPEINMDTCRACNMCVVSCPVEAIDKVTKAIDYEKCITCMCCHELCEYKSVKLTKSRKIKKS